MAENKLTRAAIDRAAPRPTQYKLADGLGLYMLVKPNGSKLWRWNYKIGIEGGAKTIAYGAYPDVSIDEARSLHATARERRRQGYDPVDARRVLERDKFKDLSATVEDVARDWLKRRQPGWSPSHYVRTEGRLVSHVFPHLGDRKINRVTTKDLVVVVQRVRSLDTSHRISQILAQVFTYAKQTGEIDANPATDLRGALPVNSPQRHHPAVTDPVRLGQVLVSFDAYGGGPVVRAALQLQPLLFCRPGELRLAEWHEVDLDRALYTVPSTRMKRTLHGKAQGEPHLIPLSRQAVAILADLKRITGPDGVVFRSNRGKGRPISDMALNTAIRAMGFSTDEVTAHGFRATARTLLDEALRERVDVVEHQLAHRVKDVLGRAYNRTSFLPERVAMMQRWSDYLDGLKTTAAGR